MPVTHDITPEAEKSLRYALLLKPHANVRYKQSLERLALAELMCILEAWGIFTEPTMESIAGAAFLIFETNQMPSQAWKAISKHSSICFAACIEDELLRPIPLQREGYMPDDIAEVLKYKGKTNADFTTMMLHCAQSASDFAQAGQPLTVLDPICGRGTSLFCATQEGHNAIGVEVDGKAIVEADTYFARYLKYHKMKHRRETASVTLPDRRNAKEIRYLFASTAEGYKTDDRRTLRLLAGDTRDVSDMLGVESCHLIIGDLPYGVQHAPKQGGRLSSLQGLLESAMSAYTKALKTGGAIALSFNTYTLSRQTVEEQMRRAGLTVMDRRPYADFSHWVEQAINRDFVVARHER